MIDRWSKISFRLCALLFSYSLIPKEFSANAVKCLRLYLFLHISISKRISNISFSFESCCCVRNHQFFAFKMFMGLDQFSCLFK